MKKLFTIVSAILFLQTAPGRVGAQTWHVEADTVMDTPALGSGLTIIPDTIVVSSGSVTLQWKTVGTNFPTDWQAATGVCDNNLCYASSPNLWPSGSLKTSNAYMPGSGSFDMQIALDTVTTLGCYYYRIRMIQSGTTDTAYETYVVCKLHPTSVPQLPVPGNNDVLLYPNPASNEINLVYDPAMDVKTLAIYNIIGKVMAVYKVAGSNANVSLDNMPAGIYFVRLTSSTGNVVATKRFTKQ